MKFQFFGLLQVMLFADLFLSIRDYYFKSVFDTRYINVLVNNRIQLKLLYIVFVSVLHIQFWIWKVL